MLEEENIYRKTLFEAVAYTYILIMGYKHTLRLTFRYVTQTMRVINVISIHIGNRAGKVEILPHSSGAQNPIEEWAHYEHIKEKD